MSLIQYEGRSVIVTGAGGGLGREYALALAQHGARVLVNDLGGSVNGDGESTNMADAVVQEIRDAGGEAAACYDSVSTPAGGRAIVEASMDAFGSVDAVIHNAGILRDRSLSKMTPEEVDSVLDVHLKGGFNVTIPAFARMKEAGYGRLVMTSSSSGLLGNYGQANYGAAKTGLVGLVHVAAIEGARHGILANAIAPGARTRMTEGLLGEMDELLDPAQVAAMAVYLASPQCHQTHEVFSAGGGRFARYVVGVNDGWITRTGPASADDVLEHIDQIRDLDSLHVFDSGTDEMALLRRMATEVGALTPSA
ncbi:NAD(P)-dependent dehydrogenase (short-subunit alcohol dehydrogenase family) [Nocardioides marinisabuli]|uniref:NAD(P)-dependent dehydrogenase (Short-subunit alcohol dehydrogenase family) n=1 Tax=Nocardioides marinisabuli TaxID=419476 RepID=A0A7Y9F061_9ACTN|nr:SDR family NAD(P)-dependent oxidoreductase [Nocardioides marinisabuli]NYD57192.1 NAD(P)-dependent dehydrogenase (short-subunit alcohol dehydrogenase family) [Nocardioides marinisabuli]